jgi:site-specific DNA recombinase
MALYARVSSGEQERQQTIDSQLDGLRTRAAELGGQVVGEYLDNPYTGTTLVRPALDQLRTDAAGGMFSVMLIHDPDRLARGRAYLRPMMHDELARHGVTISYLKYEIDDSPEGRVMDGMVSLFAEYERTKILDRTRRGMEYKVKEGHIWRARPPFGYDYIPPVKPEKHGHLVVLDDEALWVRRIFAWMADGKSALWVRDELNRLGVPTKHGRAWHDTTIGNMLRNPLYSGMAAWGRTHAVEATNPSTLYHRRAKSSFRKTDPSTWKLTPAPAIVSIDVQGRAIDVLSSNRNRSKRNTKGEYLVQGLLYCGYPDKEQEGALCGRKMTAHARAGTDLPGYRCRRRYHDPSDPHRHVYCRGKMPAWRMDSLVWAQLVAMLQQPETLTQRIDDAQHEQHHVRARQEQELDAAARAATTTQAKLTKLTERNLAGAIDDATFDQLKPTLTADRDAALERFEVAKTAMERLQTTVRQWADIRAYCADVSTQLARLEQPEYFAERQALVRALIHRVVAYPDRLGIEGLLPAAADTADMVIVPITPR